MKNNSAMTVYRASAGSGKTFTIAIRYIELLIINPLAYRETLAVTFTNKATEEMKMRILGQLYGLSRGLIDSDNYLKRITHDLNCSKEFVRKQSSIALHLILHDYSRFSVETIDSFFQRVLRNLAFELGLNAKLRVELNNTEIEEIAVDKLIAELGESHEVLKWIVDYIEHKTENDESWKVIKDIKKFGLKIFKQEYNENSEELNNRFSEKNFFNNYLQSLYKVINDADKTMADIGNNFLKLLSDNGYAIYDFYRGDTGPCSYFLKLASGKYYDQGLKSALTSSVVLAMQDSSKWYAKAKKDTPISAFAENIILPYINDTEKIRKKCACNALTANLILKNINELRLLNNIEKKIRELNVEGNRFLLSDTQNFLNSMMEDSDTSFVFEKIGGRIHNIMIDEFQDTSTLQWLNFKKLLLECMANENSQNIIVGDVKQSIYRWRNGDWRLLNNINEDPDLRNKELDINILDTNYRSEAKLVEFNNNFFTLAAVEEENLLKQDGNNNCDVIHDIFSKEQSEQKVPGNKERNGSIRITLLQKDTYDEGCLSLTKDYIIQLIDAGAKEQDIAIIVRDNTNIYKLANWLKGEIPDHNFISDEAFRLCSSVAVNLIIDAMNVLIEPDNKLLVAQLAKVYNKLVLNKNVEEVNFKTVQDIGRYLPFEFANDKENILSLPLNDIAEYIFNLFELKRIPNEAAYINSFFDQISNFSKNNIPDIKMFLEKWEESINQKSVLGGDIKGIRLLTIHKSKGLEFDHVIIPYCDWDIHKDGIIWCKTDVEPFSHMPILPVSINNSKYTVFSDAYNEECLQRCIDNLNLLYVAFTRAAMNLFVIGRNVNSKKDGVKTSTRSGLLQIVIPQLIDAIPDSNIEGNINETDETIVFSSGTIYVKEKKDKKSENVFLRNSSVIDVNIDHYIKNIKFLQSNRSRSFVSGEDNGHDNQKYITLGSIMHNVLSHIHDAGDVEKVLDSFVNEGIISENDEQINKQTLSKLIRNRVENNSNKVVKRWFEKDVEVFNECSILSLNPMTGMTIEHRPDRVVKYDDCLTVIDFKFGSHKPEYVSQVRNYMSLLADMGYSNIDGYLWYIYTNEFEKIEL